MNNCPAGCRECAVEGGESCRAPGRNCAKAELIDEISSAGASLHRLVAGNDK